MSICTGEHAVSCCNSGTVHHERAFEGGEQCCTLGNAQFSPTNTAGSIFTTSGALAFSTGKGISSSGSVWTGKFVDGCPYGLAYCAKPDPTGKVCERSGDDDLANWRCVFDSNAIANNDASTFTPGTSNTHTTFTRGFSTQGSQDTLCDTDYALMSAMFDLTPANTSIHKIQEKDGTTTTEANDDWRPWHGPATFSVLKGRYGPVDSVTAACACTEFGLLPPRTPHWPMVDREASRAGEVLEKDYCEITTGAKRCTLDNPCFGDSPGPGRIAGVNADDADFTEFLGGIDAEIQALAPVGGASNGDLKTQLRDKLTAITSMNCYDDGQCRPIPAQIIQNRISWSEVHEDGTYDANTYDPDDPDRSEGTWLKIDRDSSCKCGSNSDFNLSCKVTRGGSQIKANLYWYVEQDRIFAKAQNKYSVKGGGSGARTAACDGDGDDDRTCAAYPTPSPTLNNDTRGDIRKSRDQRGIGYYDYPNFCGENTTKNSCLYRGKVKAQCSNYLERPERKGACRGCPDNSSAATMKFTRGIKAAAKCPKNEIVVTECGQRSVSAELKPGDLCQWRSAGVFLANGTESRQTDLATNPFLRTWATEDIGTPFSEDVAQLLARRPGHKLQNNAVPDGSLLNPLLYNNPWMKSILTTNQWCGFEECATDGECVQHYPGFPFSKDDAQRTGTQALDIVSAKIDGVTRLDKPVRQYDDGVEQCTAKYAATKTNVGDAPEACLAANDGTGENASCLDSYFDATDETYGNRCKSRSSCPAFTTTVEGVQTCGELPVGTNCTDFYQTQGGVTSACADAPNTSQTCTTDVLVNACNVSGATKKCKPDTLVEHRCFDSQFPECQQKYKAYYAPRFANYPQRKGELRFNNIQDTPSNLAKKCAWAEITYGSGGSCVAEGNAVAYKTYTADGREASSITITDPGVPYTMRDIGLGTTGSAYGFAEGEMFGSRVTDYLPFAICTEAELVDGKYTCKSEENFENWQNLVETPGMKERLLIALELIQDEVDVWLDEYSREEMSRGALISATGPANSISEDLERWGMVRDSFIDRTNSQDITTDGGEKLAVVGDYEMALQEGTTIFDLETQQELDFAGNATTNFTDIYRCQFDLDKMLGLGKFNADQRWIPDDELSDPDLAKRIRYRQAALSGHNNTVNGPENWGLSEHDMLQIFHAMRLDLSFKGDGDAPCKLDGTMTSDAPLKNMCVASTSPTGTVKGWAGATHFPGICKESDDNGNVTNTCCNFTNETINTEETLLANYDGSAGPAVNMCANHVAPYYTDLLTLRANFETFSSLMWHWSANVVRGAGSIERTDGTLIPYTADELCRNLTKSDPLAGYLGCSVGAMNTNTEDAIRGVDNAAQLFVWWWATLNESRKKDWIEGNLCRFNADLTNTKTKELACKTVLTDNGLEYSRADDIAVTENLYLKECSCVNRAAYQSFCEAKNIYARSQGVSDTCWYPPCAANTSGNAQFYNCPPSNTTSSENNWKTQSDGMAKCTVENYCVQSINFENIIAKNLNISDISQCNCCSKGLAGDVVDTIFNIENVSGNVNVNVNEGEATCGACEATGAAFSVANADCLVAGNDIRGTNCADFWDDAGGGGRFPGTNCVKCSAVAAVDGACDDKFLSSCIPLTYAFAQEKTPLADGSATSDWISTTPLRDRGQITPKEQFLLQSKLCLSGFIAPSDCDDASKWLSGNTGVFDDGTTYWVYDQTCDQAGATPRGDKKLYNDENEVAAVLAASCRTCDQRGVSKILKANAGETSCSS